MSRSSYKPAIRAAADAEGLSGLLAAEVCLPLEEAMTSRDDALNARLHAIALRLMATTEFSKDAHTVMEASVVLSTTAPLVQGYTRNMNNAVEGPPLSESAARQVPPHRSGGSVAPGEVTKEMLREMFEQECKDGDRLAEVLGVPRTEGGWLNVPKMIAKIKALRSNGGTSEKELARLREIEHRVWHVLDDSEEDATTGNISITPSDDYLKLCDLLPEDHPSSSQEENGNG